MKNFTFKTTKPIGKYKSFDNPYHEIKFEGSVVGNIDPDTPHRIRLMVIKDDINSDGNPNCSWKWITLKCDFTSVENAKIWLNSVKDKIHSQFNLHKLEE